MLKILISGLLLASSAVAFAIPIQYASCVDSTNGAPNGVVAAADATTCSATAPTDNLLLIPSSPNTLTFAHSLLGSGFLTTDSIISATLVIDLRDDQGPSDGSEKVSIFIDFNGNGSFADAGEQVADNSSVGTFSCVGSCNNSLLAGLTDGLLNIRLDVVPGMGGDRDFLFVDSLLTVTVDSPLNLVLESTDAAVPEPGMLMLIAAGLGGLWLSSSRRRKMLS